MMSQIEFELHSWNTPNGQKIHIALREAQANYTYVPIDITSGQQKTEVFKGLSPDGKIPALIHHNKTDKVVLFESGAILLYLANHYPAINGQTEQEKAAVMAWVFWQVGQLGPLAGQFGRFSSVDPDNEAAIDHFQQCVWRCLDVLEHRLQQSQYLAGDRFTVADMASLPWVASPQSYLQRYDVKWRSKYPALAEWADQLILRAAVREVLIS